MSTVTYSLFPVSTWLSDHVPGASEVPDGGSINLYDVALNTTTNMFYCCVDPTVNAMVWQAWNVSVSSGDATMALGTVTVSYAALTSGQKIKLSYKTPSGTPGAVYVSSMTAGTGFTIHSTSLLDSSTVHWEVFN